MGRKLLSNRIRRNEKVKERFSIELQVILIDDLIM